MNQPNNLWDDRPYRPTSVTISIDEWDRMNKELEELRQWKEAAIKSSSWNVKHEGNPYTWTSGKHDQTPTTKPPFGLMPLKFHEESRYKDVSEAIVRYRRANKEVPKEWINEWEYLNSKLCERDEEGMPTGWPSGPEDVVGAINRTQDPETSREYNRPHPDIKYGQPQTTGAGVLAYFGKFGELPIDTATAGQTLGMDGNWHPKKDENYFAWDTNFGAQSFVNLNPEMGRIDMEKYGRLFPTKEAAEDYGRTTTTNALLPLMELKMAVDRGETIVDDMGNTIVKHPNGYDYNSKLWLDGFTKSWEAMVDNYMSKSKGWRIERTTEPEPDNYSEILAELHLGKTFQAEDGTILKCDFDKEKGAFVGTDTVIHGLVPWSDVVEKVLKRHKGWKKV